MLNPRVTMNQWSYWKQYPWISMASVTNAYVADARYMHFTDPSHVDKQLPQKGDVVEQLLGVTTLQWNPTGWPNAQSYLSGTAFTADAIGAALAGTDIPFFFAYEFQVQTAPANSAMMWVGDASNVNKAHGILFTGTAANFQVVRGDGTTSKNGAVIACSLSTPHVFVHMFDGHNLTTYLDGVRKDNGVDLHVGPIPTLSRLTMSGIRLGVTSNTCLVQSRSQLFGAGVLPSTDELTAIQDFLRVSAGV